MLDLENIKSRLMYEQKRADDASEKVEKLNEEVSKDELILEHFKVSVKWDYPNIEIESNLSI